MGIVQKNNAQAYWHIDLTPSSGIQNSFHGSYIYDNHDAQAAAAAAHSYTNMDPCKIELRI